MRKSYFNWKETPVCLGWIVASVVLLEVLENSPALVLCLKPVAEFMLSDPSCFSYWNRSPPFNTVELKTLTAVFLLLVPIQIFTFFLIPRESVCSKVQAKGVSVLVMMMLVLALLPALTFAWGLSINGPLKLFGKESHWGAAVAISLVSVTVSYLVRLFPVLLALRGHEKFVVES